MKRVIYTNLQLKSILRNLANNENSKFETCREYILSTLFARHRNTLANMEKNTPNHSVIATLNMYISKTYLDEQ